MNRKQITVAVTGVFLIGVIGLVMHNVRLTQIAGGDPVVVLSDWSLLENPVGKFLYLIVISCTVVVGALLMWILRTRKPNA